MRAVSPCPRCGTNIVQTALRCRYCGLDLEPTSDAKAISDWVAAHSTLTVSLATFLYVTFQVYKAADFSVNTAVELLRAGGLTAILTGVFLVELQYELLLIGIVGCYWLTTARRAQSVPSGVTTGAASWRSDERFIPTVLLAVVLIICFWTIPWPLFVGLLLLCLWARRIAGAAEPQRSLLWKVVHIGAAATFTFLLLQRPTIWVPAEAVATRHDSVVVGYVISTGDNWVTILTPSWTNHLGSRPSDVIRVKADDVLSRQPCAIDFAEAKLFGKVLRLRPVQAITAVVHGRLPRTVTPPCPK